MKIIKKFASFNKAMKFKYAYEKNKLHKKCELNQLQNDIIDNWYIVVDKEKTCTTLNCMRSDVDYRKIFPIMFKNYSCKLNII